MDTSKITFFITGGPSRERLFDHVKYLHEENAPIVPAKFSTWAEGINAKVMGTRIDAIRHENNTGHALLLEGTCIVETVNSVDTEYSQHKFRAFYNSKRRKGKLELLS